MRARASGGASLARPPGPPSAGGVGARLAAARPSAAPRRCAAPAFFRPANLRDLLVGNAPVLVAAIGMTLVILARQIDISIGSQFAICGVAAGLLAKAGLPMPLAGLGAVATGALLGALNGALVAGLGLPSIVVTLATMVHAARGAALGHRRGVGRRTCPPASSGSGSARRPGACVIPLARSPSSSAFAWGLAARRRRPRGLRHRLGRRGRAPRGHPAPARGLRRVRGHGRAHRPRRAPDRDPVHRRPDERRRRPGADGHRGGGGGRHRDLRRPRAASWARCWAWRCSASSGPALTFLGTPGATGTARSRGSSSCSRWPADAFERRPEERRVAERARRRSAPTSGSSALLLARGDGSLRRRRPNFLTRGNAFEVARASVEIGLLALALTAGDRHRRDRPLGRLAARPLRRW